MTNHIKTRNIKNTKFTVQNGLGSKENLRKIQRGKRTDTRNSRAKSATHTLQCMEVANRDTWTDITEPAQKPGIIQLEDQKQKRQKVKFKVA